MGQTSFIHIEDLVKFIFKTQILTKKFKPLVYNCLALLLVSFLVCKRLI